MSGWSNLKMWPLPVRSGLLLFCDWRGWVRHPLKANHQTAPEVRCSTSGAHHAVKDLRKDQVDLNCDVTMFFFTFFGLMMINQPVISSPGNLHWDWKTITLLWINNQNPKCPSSTWLWFCLNQREGEHDDGAEQGTRLTKTPCCTNSRQSK